MGSTRLARHAGPAAAARAATTRMAITPASVAVRIGVHHHHRRQPLTRLDRGNDAGQRADGDGLQRVEHHLTQHGAGPLAQCEPDAKLACPLRDGVRDDTVQADNGEERGSTPRAFRSRAHGTGPERRCRLRERPWFLRRSARCPDRWLSHDPGARPGHPRTDGSTRPAARCSRAPPDASGRRRRRRTGR